MREYSSKSLFRTLILKWKRSCFWWIFSSVPVKGAYFKKHLCFVSGKMEEPSILKGAFQINWKDQTFNCYNVSWFWEVSCFTGSLVPKSQVPEEECCWHDTTPQVTVAVWLWSWPQFPCVSWGTLSFLLKVKKNQCYFKKKNKNSWVHSPGPY